MQSPINPLPLEEPSSTVSDHMELTGALGGQESLLGRTALCTPWRRLARGGTSGGLLVSLGPRASDLSAQLTAVSPADGLSPPAPGAGLAGHKPEGAHVLGEGLRLPQQSSRICPGLCGQEMVDIR